MKDSDFNNPDSRYVVGIEPVNRRTADPQLRAPPPDPAQLMVRARQLHQKHALGAPLAEVLESRKAQASTAAVPGLAIAGLVAGTALLPLAVFSGSLWVGALLGSGSVLSLGYAARRIVAARRAAAPAALASGRPPLVDAQALEALDRVMEAIAPELDESLMNPLVRLKHTLVRLIELDHAAAAAPFIGEDHLYLQQCVKRYLPDSLQAYLKVPAQHRSRPIAQDGRTPAQTLAAQLTLIQQELDRREQQGVEAAGEALLSQQRFLEAKAQRPF